MWVLKLWKLHWWAMFGSELPCSDHALREPGPHATLSCPYHPSPPPPARLCRHAASAWGLEALRYEIRDITPPQSVRHAMDLQAEAERRKRAQVGGGRVAVGRRVWMWGWVGGWVGTCMSNA